MFTGIVQGTGRVVSVTPITENRSSLRLDIELGECGEGLQIGDSVAIDGVCLTATTVHGSCCTFELIQETARTTSLGTASLGTMVNIERSLRADDRLEGHFVLGHVDGTGTVTEIRTLQEEVRLCIHLDAGLGRYMVRKGSVAVNGVSLTVTKIDGDILYTSLIPHTLSATNLGSLQTGSRVNIETDILGKYVLQKML